MTEDSDLPSGRQPVCPRCGTPAGDGAWCQDCGLNLRLQGELPTADAYAAGVRERRWLDAQAAQADAARAAEWRARDERVVAEADQRARDKGERNRVRIEEAGKKKAQATERKAERRPRRTKRLLALSVGALLLLGAGAATFVVLRSDGAEQTPRPQRTDPMSTTSEADRPPPDCSRATAQRELERRNLLGEGFFGISRLICRDFTGDGAKDAAFTRASTGSSGTLGWGVLVAKAGGWDLPLVEQGDAQVGIKANGMKLLRSEPVADEADPSAEAGEGAIIEVYRHQNGEFRMENDYREFGEAFPEGFYGGSDSEEEPAGIEQCGDLDPAPIQNVTAENIDCDTALDVAEDQAEAERLGWKCTDTDTGYESSHTACTKGGARVTYDFAV